MASADVLNYMQMEALGLHRREKILTSDHPENRASTSVSALQDLRRGLGAGYKPAKQGKNKVSISAWQNIHEEMQDDGTAGPEDLGVINEGLGQTHRAKLIENPDVRAYTGEHHSRKDRYRSGDNGPKKSNKGHTSQMVPLRQAGRPRVTRGRIVKGDVSSKATASASVTGMVANIRLPGLKSLDAPPRKAQDTKSSSEQVRASIERQQRVINRITRLSEPQDFLARYQERVPTSQPKQIPLTSADSISNTAKKASEATEPDANSIPSLQGLSRTLTGTGSDHTAQFKLPAQKHEPVKEVSPRPDKTPTPISSDPGAVSLAYLMSLNISFTPEQIRLLTAHSQGQPKADTPPETPTFPEREALSPSVSDHHLDTTSAPLASIVSPKAPLVNNASSDSDSAPSSPVLSKPIPATASKKAAIVPSNSTGVREEALKPKASGSGTGQDAKALPLAATETLGLSDRSLPIGKPSPMETIASSNIISSGKAKLPNSPDTVMPIKFTFPQTTAAVRSENAVPSSALSASAKPLSEVLKQQREMIIGSEVYKNRYSHVAGSLVDKFQALTLKDLAPNTRLATAANPDIVSSRSFTPVAQSSSVIQPPPQAQQIPSGSHMMRPKFIPNPASCEPSALAPKSVNGSAEETLRSQGARSERSSGPSLPPHLRGKTASTDSGAAA